MFHRSSEIAGVFTAVCKVQCEDSQVKIYVDLSIKEKKYAKTGVNGNICHYDSTQCCVLLIPIGYQLSNNVTIM